MAIAADTQLNIPPHSTIHLQNIGVSASASGAVVTINSNSINSTTYRDSTSSGATETVLLTNPVSGWQTATIAGTTTTGDVLTLTMVVS